ncbi:MAG: hypothetical protein ACK4NY_06860 [Spirosomataceae bacterium]
MKNLLSMCLIFVASNILGQDYIVKPDGTKYTGKAISMSKNTLYFRTQNDNIGEYKIDRLAVIHIEDPNFKMKGVILTNTNYEKDDSGIHIEMLNNPIVKTSASPKSSTTNVNIQSERSSSLSITTDDDSPKAKIVLKCVDCSNSGLLTMESEDKLSKVVWEFDYQNDSAFPMKIELDSGKTYKFKYKDKNRHSIEKKVQIKAGENIINVFQ